MVKINNNNNNENNKNNIACSILASRDMAMEDLKKYYFDFCRIIVHGPSCQHDVLIIKKCLIFCAGEIQRNAQEFSDFQDVE